MKPTLKQKPDWELHYMFLQLHLIEYSKTNHNYDLHDKKNETDHFSNNLLRCHYDDDIFHYVAVAQCGCEASGYDLIAECRLNKEKKDCFFLFSFKQRYTLI